MKELVHHAISTIPVVKLSQNLVNMIRKNLQNLNLKQVMARCHMELFSHL
jgi:hypothetical protein